MGILDRVFRKGEKEEPLKEFVTFRISKPEEKKEPRGTGVVCLEDIIKAEGVDFIEKEEKDVRYCYECGEKIRKGGGYLAQAAIPAYARGMPVVAFSSLTGTSCEHRDGDHPLALWYWFCDQCGSQKLSGAFQSIEAEAARHFWRTGQPPKRPPVWQDEL